MDRGDLDNPEIRQITHELNQLVQQLTSRDLAISSWYGSLELTKLQRIFERLNRGLGYVALEDPHIDANWPWFLYWEIGWLVINNEFLAGQKLLDLGGSSSLFSYYLASKGLQVTTIDLNPKLVANANAVAEEMGWTLENKVMDMRNISFDECFDHITSVCVYEHIPITDRVTINDGVADLLVDGGTFSITFDYRNPSREAAISSPRSVERQFIKPSGLSIRGNATFYDSRINYLTHPYFLLPRSHPIRKRDRHLFRLRDRLFPKRSADYTFGALFLAKDAR